MKSKTNFIILVIIWLLPSSCEKFIEIEAPRDKLVPSSVYNSNDLATSAVLGLYERMSVSGYASGDSKSISTICGLTADEFIGYGGDLLQIYGNEIIPENQTLGSVWSLIYTRVYNANAILEGLQTGQGISPTVKSQLQGEALFIRAFNYFYLINLYGAVPLNLNTDYIENGKSIRASVEQVYTQIIKDLETSQQLLSENYITTERIRPNKATAEALLARVYLYMGDWVNAEKYSTLVLDRTSIYSLTSLDQVFLSNSKETIWQLMPPVNGNTPAGNLLILTTIPTTGQVSLMPNFVLNSFEVNDQRKTSWVKSVLSGSTTYYYPFKYKVRLSTSVSEYTMVFRLAEQFLIRSEARAQQNKLIKGIEDLDVIRSRAGLLLIKNVNPTINKDDLLNAIRKERKVELFSEWGHRWFDLKRTGQASTVFNIVKPGWDTKYLLFPIPKDEIGRSPNIIQNPGY